jgi:predicted Zn-dependent protease
MKQKMDTWPRLDRPRKKSAIQRLWLCGIATTALAAPACKQKNQPAPTPAVSATASSGAPGCVSGQSVDPNQAEFRPAIDAFKDANYAKAEQLLDALIKSYPKSATVLVWRGDAALFDKRSEYKRAADDALGFYEKAAALQARGCRLPEVERYYLRFDSALANLRKAAPDPAIAELELSKQEWSDSAEVAYNLARAYCLKKAVDTCYENFELTLTLAKSLRRPRFLRSQYTVDDWIRRSKTQSEFPALRKDSRYAPLIQKMSK